MKTEPLGSELLTREKYVRPNSPHPNPLPGGEGAPSAVLGMILVSDQFHRWIQLSAFRISAFPHAPSAEIAGFQQ
jgi:hypothetical protein